VLFASPAKWIISFWLPAICNLEKKKRVPSFSLNILSFTGMSPPPHNIDSLDMAKPSINGRHLGSIEEDAHAKLISEHITDFDLVDIGAKQESTSADLKDVRNILVTGGAGFM
jgi:hypothetical protein